MSTVYLPESRFTWPVPYCPNPDYWHSADGDSTEIEVSELIASLVRAVQPEYCIETGAGMGQTSQMIGEALVRNGHGRLIALENDPERVNLVRARCQHLSTVTVVEIDSLLYTPTEPIDFILFDSYYEMRVPEFLRYGQQLHPGSLVLFHDTATLHGSHRIADGIDLKTQIDKEIGHQIKYIEIHSPRGLLIGEVL